MADKRKYADRREELIKAVAKRRRKVKLLAIESKGGKCQICGYSKNVLPHWIFITSAAKNYLVLATKDILVHGKRSEKK